MKREALENILLQVRITILELMVLRLHVVVGSLQSHRPLPELRNRLEAELEDMAKGLETKTFDRPDLKRLTGEERALFADEFRETIEQLKSHLHALFP